MTAFKRGRGRPGFDIPTPTATHKKLLDHFNGNLDGLAKTLDTTVPQVRRWLLADDWPLKKLVRLHRRTPLELEELLVLSKAGRDA